MRKKENNKYIFFIFIGLALFGLVIMMMAEVNHIQGNAKVINYNGIVRGATQRIIKKELYGIADDAAIKRMDNILYELRTGEGAYSLTVLHDELYLKNLQIQNDYWQKLKQYILLARNDPKQKDMLYKSSEEYFNLANETVSSAELYSDGVAKSIRILEVLIILLIVIVLICLTWTTVKTIRKNKYLDSITYIDVNTGLPNKRRCEEKLKEVNSSLQEKNLCCFMFDLNNLKVINDTLGHQWGDFLILSFASFLRQVSPSSMFIGRFGGDEFIGIYENTTKEDIQKFLDNLNNNSKNLNFTQDGKTIKIQFAYGYAFSLDYPDCSSQILMDIADKNMYKNKQLMKSLNHE